MTAPLCSLPADAPHTCCGAAPPPPASPLLISNSPGLPAIAYRVGNFTSFRRAMLDRVAVPDLLGPGKINPFLKWREGGDGDYQTALIELWAYLADILTLYQERIANEAFLPTASERDSLLRLSRLIAYRPAPGAGASGLVAFTVEKGKLISIPAGFRAGNKPKPPVPSAVFETSSAVVARSENNAIPLSPVAPRNQFARLTNLTTVFQPSFGIDADVGALEDVFGDAGDFPFISGFLRGGFLEASPIGLGRKQAPSKSPGRRPRPLPIRVGERTVVLAGTSTRLAAGDYVLAVANEGLTGEIARPFRLTSVSPDKPGNTTTLKWQEIGDLDYDQSQVPVNLYALRVTAGAFGNAAPAFNTLSAALTGTITVLNAQGAPVSVTGPLVNQNWDDNSNDWHYLPTPGDPSTQIHLDEENTGIASPDWAVLSSDAASDAVFHVTDARTVSKAAYTLSSKTTRLTLREAVSLKTSPIRSTVIRSGAELLTLQNNLPLGEEVRGDRVILSGLQSQLAVGQTVVFQGTVFGTGADGSVPVVNAEVRTIKPAPVLDTNNNLTVVTINRPLDRSYVRALSQLLANIAEVTQGETVPREVAGSGDGSPFQSFALKKKPLTYMPSTDPEGTSAVASTLILSVNGVLWSEVPSLVETQPDSQVYSLSQDDSGQTTLEFGDGFNGARPPTGKDNIIARYRKGLGASGNLPPGSVAQMLDSVAGLQGVTNPLPTGGGADAESVSSIRTSAPASVQTFSRAISVADYASLALTFPGIAKASAAWITRDSAWRALAYPYVQLTVATSDQVPLSEQPTLAARLRDFLAIRRDPNVTLRIIDVQEIYLDLTATVDLDDHFPQQGTLSAVRAAMNPGANPDQSAGFFAFERLSFGQPVHLSGVYAALLAVPGVVDATVTLFRRLDLDTGSPTLVRDHIFLKPTEIAAIRNDPQNPSQGTLTINLGKGGFADA